MASHPVICPLHHYEMFPDRECPVCVQIQRDRYRAALEAAVEDCSMSMAPDVMEMCLKALGREGEQP